RPGSSSARVERTADDLLAGTLGNRDPGVFLGVRLGRAGARRMVGLAVVLASLRDAVALLHVALGVNDEGGRGDCSGKRGSDGDTGRSHKMLHGTMPILYQHKRHR